VRTRGTREELTHAGDTDLETTSTFAPRGAARSVRAVLAAVALLGFAHAALYVFSVPPWGLEDEEQHVDYVLTLRDSGKPPNIHQTTRPAISASAIATDHYKALGLGTAPPPGTPPEALGLEGLSYEGYQPPLYYATMVPLVAPLGDHVLVAMYVLRLADAILVGVLCALAALLAALHVLPEHRRLAALVAGCFVAVIPTVAESGARASNDMLTAVMITATAVGASYVLARPALRPALATGALAAGAVLTKSTGLAVLAFLVPLAVLLAMRRRLPGAVSAALVLPPIVAALAWAAVTRVRYGVWSGDSAFLQISRPFESLPIGDALVRTFRHAAFPYGRWGIPLAVPIAIVVVVGIGIGLALADRRGRVLAVGALVTALAILAGYLFEIDRGLTTITARLLVPSYAMLCASAGAGYATLRRRWVPAIAIAAGVTLAVTFFVSAFVVQYPFRAG
jgi:4-amino-4-deoxy-L-arabinose transferase-like glycosyltransferase